MRRFALPAILACLATILAAVPARANPAASPAATSAAAMTASLRTQAKAMGLQFAGYHMTTTLVGSHEHIWTFNSPPWVGPNDRVYRLRINLIGINHWPEPGDLDDWQPKVIVDCTRSYGGQTVQSACNIDLASFSAIGFQTATGETKTIFGTANPGDANCILENGYTGVRREAPVNRSYVMAYLGYVQVRFLDNLSNCGSLHLSNTYRAAGYRTDIFDDPDQAFDYEESVWDNSRTGLFVT